MSLHAQLSPEVQATLRKQKRISTVSSIVISLLLCALLAIILWIIALNPFFKNNEETVSYASTSDSDQEITKPEMTNEVETKPSAPSSNMAKVIAASTPSATAVPVPEITVSEPSLDFGDGDDFGDGWGNDAGTGTGNNGGGFKIPADMQKRCSRADRLQRITKEGGKPEFEEQVITALKYLEKTQNKDGSWQSTYAVGHTGLALLAYLGHCETPRSFEFGETVQKAIVYLINISQKNGGKLTNNIAATHWPYDHAIATYALAEAYTLCKEFKITIPHLEETVQMAGDFIIANQHESGGWAYSYAITGERGLDTSVACWQLQALKACKTTHIPIKGIEASAKAGIKYLESCKHGDDALRYSVRNFRNGTMTAAGALCMQQWGKGKRAFTRNMIKWIGKRPKFDYKTNSNLYVHYYASQAMINAQGSAWKKYNESAIFPLAAAQNKDGSWPASKSETGAGANKHYDTCMATLTLEVYYRFLPSS